MQGIKDKDGFLKRMSQTIPKIKAFQPNYFKCFGSGGRKLSRKLLLEITSFHRRGTLSVLSLVKLNIGLQKGREVFKKYFIH